MNEILTERPNLFEPNVYIAMCVELSGNVCPQKLTAAIRKAYGANEAAMSRIVLEHGIACYERMPFTGCRTAISDQDWLELVHENEKIPFAINEGELIRTFVIPGTHTRILVMAHHLAGDGKSILYFIKDVMNALAGTPLPYKPLSLVTKSSLAGTPLSIPAKYFVRYCSHKWNHEVFTWQDYYRLHDKYWKTFSSHITYKTLSAAETERIIREAGQTGCSVNSYLVTLFLRKYQRKCEIGIPVSIREKGNEAMSNLTSGISIHSQYDPGKTFAENAVLVHGKIKKELGQKRLSVLQFLAGLPPTLIDAALLSAYDCFPGERIHQGFPDRLARQTAGVMGYTGKTRDMGITNLMIPDIPVLYGEHKIENIIFVPPAISYSHDIYGILTVNGKMTVSFHDMDARAAVP